mgnify:CR=1 FL=1
MILGKVKMKNKLMDFWPVILLVMTLIFHAGVLQSKMSSFASKEDVTSLAVAVSGLADAVRELRTDVRLERANVPSSPPR